MKVRELLTEETWTRPKYRALDESGKPCNPTDDGGLDKNGKKLPKAVKWCLVGAIEKCYPDAREREKVFAAMSEVTERLFGMSHLGYFSDRIAKDFSEVKFAIEQADI